MDSISSLVGLVDFGRFASQWVSVLVEATLKGLVVLAIAGLVTTAMRSASAAARHAVWALALGSILALPLFSALLPNWELGIFPAIEVEGSSAVVAPAQTSTADGSVVQAVNVLPAGTGLSPDVSATAVSPATRSVLSPVIAPRVAAIETASTLGVFAVPIAIVWGLGALLVLGMLLTGLMRTSFIANRALPVLESEWVRMSDRLRRRLGIRRPVVLLRNEAATTPATWGVFNPIVLLPAVSDGWSLERRRDVLVHELAHVKRLDFLTQIIGRYACAVFWFNPFMWLAARQMRVERERACDDEVLRAGTKPSEYAGHLLEIARSVKSFSAASFSSVAMAQRSQLSGRLLAILEDGRHRGPLSRGGTVIAFTIAFMFFVPLASMTTITAQMPQEAVAVDGVVAPDVANVANGTSVISQSVPVDEPTPTPMSRPVLAGESQKLQWASAPGCYEADRDSESRGINENSSNDRRTSRFWDGDCEGEVRIRGEVQFTPDYTGIRSVSRDGHFSIEIDMDGDSRRVELRADGRGLQRRWFVNGSESTYGSEAEEWLPRALQDFFRHSSFDIDGRVRFILTNGGVPGLLAQAEQSHGEYLARRFYVAAIETREIDPDQVAAILRRAMRTVTSDFEMARLLRAIHGDDLRDENLRRTYIQASNTIGSDFEKARVLRALLEQEGLQTDVVQMLLESAHDIGSDFELARLLTAIGTRYLDDPTARDSYLSATRSIASDFELQRVLASLLEAENLSTENLRLLLMSGRSIQSDFESARLLMNVAGKFVVEESLRRLFFESVDGIGSDFERQRVLTTLVNRDDISNDVVSDAIRSASAIGGDFAKATVLKAIADKYRSDTTLRSQLEAAAETISSDHEYGRVMSAIRGRRS